MEFTQKETLAMLEESGRVDWNLRQMTALRNQGFLPPLKRKSLPGTNRPQYIWDETDLDQIADAYDWWSFYEGNREMLGLALWLKGYDVPLDFLRRTYLSAVDMYLQLLTRGKTDPEDILDEVSKIVVVWIRKMKFAPGLADQRKKMVTEQNVNMEQTETVLEAVLSALAVPNEEVDADTIYSSFLDRRESQETSKDNEVDGDVFVQFQVVATILRDIFTLPHLRETIQTAKPEQWQQAKKDYLSLCHVLKVIEERRPSKSEVEYPEGFLMNLRITGAVWLILPLLSARCRGYGRWIDIGFEKMYEFLADPSIQERILKRYKAKNVAESDIDDKEKPELSFPE